MRLYVVDSIIETVTPITSIATAGLVLATQSRNGVMITFCVLALNIKVRVVIEGSRHGSNWSLRAGILVWGMVARWAGRGC